MHRKLLESTGQAIKGLILSKIFQKADSIPTAAKKFGALASGGAIGATGDFRERAAGLVGAASTV